MKPFIYLAIGASLGTFVYMSFVPRAVNKPNIAPSQIETQTATFAGGCFWCTEADFEKLNGVVEAISGYAGGTAETATYEQTSNKTTNHREVVQVKYDTNQLSYKQLADYHLRHIDPTDNEGQFVDRGFVYSPALFFETLAEEQAAQMAVAELKAENIFDKEINIAIEKAKTFYPAEDYHQDYYLKKPAQYVFYRSRSGRNNFLETTYSN